MSLSKDEAVAVEQFLKAFGLSDRADVQSVGRAMFSQKQLVDLNASREYVDQFVKKCERRDPNGVKPLKKRVYAVMDTSDQMTLMMDFVVRCRQAHLFHTATANGSFASSSSATPSIQSSPFNRRSASRTRVLSTLTGEPSVLPNDSTRSRATSSFTSHDTRMIGMERQRPKSPFRINGTPANGLPTTAVSPLTASNYLFTSQNELTLRSQEEEFETPSSHHYMRTRDESPSYLRSTPMSQQSVTSSTIRSTAINSKSTTPLYSRIGSAMTHPESHVCECLLAACLGIETRLFTPIHRKMSITSTASLSTSHITIAHRVLLVANAYLTLSHREVIGQNCTVSLALMAAIKSILGNYTADIDGLRRRKNLRFAQIMPAIDKWHDHLQLLLQAHKLRSIGQLELLESLYILHESNGHDEERREVLDTVVKYTMGVFCNEMMDWMTVGEAPAEKWMIHADPQSGQWTLRKVPIFMSELDAKILLEIGKSLPRLESASDEDLAAIDKATTVVRSALGHQLIFEKRLTSVLSILRNVVCGCVMKLVLTTGRLKEHIHKACSFFLLQDPRFTVTLYNCVKTASSGLRVGSASLSRQTVASALAEALQATTSQDRKENKLKFTLDSITSLGSTPNISSKMQFVQPLHPKYLPTMDVMKPIFQVCDDDYEAIFHVIWSIDLCRLSTQESAAHLPAMHRFLLGHLSLRENGWCLLNMLSHIFFVLNATLSRVRSHIAVQMRFFLLQFMAAIDEKCGDIDDVLREHKKFTGKLAVVTWCRGNELIEHELANLIRVAFEAQEVLGEMVNVWEQTIETTAADENVRKAKMAEMCQKRVLPIRMLMETVNKSQSKLSELLDQQVAFGNDALVE